jgi:hypothetical protein
MLAGCGGAGDAPSWGEAGSLRRVGEQLTVVCDDALDPPAVTYDGNSISALAGVTHLTHDLTLTGGFSGDLSVLSCLRQIDGRLFISGTTGLTSLAGLENLATVQDDISVFDNATLESASFDALISVAGIEVDRNPRLENVRAPLLTALDYLVAITNGASALAPTAFDLSGVTSMRSLVLFENDTLEDISGLASLRTAGEVFVLENAALENLDGFAALESTGHFIVSGNPALTSLDSLSALATVDGWFTIQNNDKVTSLDQLAALTSVDMLDIEFNDHLVTADGFSALTQVGLVTVVGNSRLTSFSAPLLTELGGTLRFELNGTQTPAATTFDLSSVAAIHGSVSLHHNAGWELGTGLAALALVEGDLEAYGNPGLTELALTSLAKVTGRLNVSTNITLASLTLPVLTSLGFPLGIVNNQLLPTCDATQVRDLLLAHGFRKRVIISGNLRDGCGG